MGRNGTGHFYECVERDCSGGMGGGSIAMSLSPMSHLDFRREIAICLLEMSMVSRLQVGGGPRVNLVMMSGLMEKTIRKYRLPKADARSAKKIAVRCVQSATCGCTMTAGQNAMSPTTCAVDSLNNSLKS